MTIQQGNLYTYRDQRVLAVQGQTNQNTVRCVRLDPRHPSGLGPTFWAKAADLEPLPMRYYKGQIP